MNIIITHGYLLTGTGSNLYVNNLVREWCKVGHNVYLVCQEPRPMDIDFVTTLYEFGAENTKISMKSEKDSPFPGPCSCFIPDIDGLLPVYVYDHYDGFVVKEFPDCSDEELEKYIQLNTNALETILSSFDVDVIQTNHTVMFPYIAQKAMKSFGVVHYATVHGSALNFTVKKYERFVDYAIKGLESASRLLVDSKHAEEELIEFLEEKQRQDLIERIKIIPAGVDITRFEIPEESRSVQIDNFSRSIAELCQASEGRSEQLNTQIAELTISNPELNERLQNIRQQYDYRNIDQNAAEKIVKLKNHDGPIVLFIGKYLWTKGIHLILSAVPYILKSEPNTHFVFVGFGPFREIAELIINSYDNTEVEKLISALELNPELFTGEDQELPLLRDFLIKHQEELVSLTKEHNLMDHITFTGIVGHKELIHLLPAADVLIAPSVFPEAFGMVAIEAMACGVYPVLSYQSAFKEITDELEDILQDWNVEISKVLLDADAPVNIARNTTSYLSRKRQFASKEEYRRFQNALRQLVVDKYSWKGIAESYLVIYGSELSSTSTSKG